MSASPVSSSSRQAAEDAGREAEPLAAYERASPRTRLWVAAAVALVVAGLACAVVAGLWRASAATEIEVLPEPEASAATIEDAPAEGEAATRIFVHVGGAVREPGLYVLEPGARVVDAVGAALGFTDDAARDGLNLARVLVDGEQVLVPVEGEEQPPPGGGEAGGGGAPGGASGGAADASGGGLVNLNTATAADLDALPRIGPAIAGRIIAWREENGPFASVEDLLAVSGIGEKMLETLRPLVTT